MRKFPVAAVIALSLLPGLARAAEPPCLTPAEFTSLASYVLPNIITGTSQRCAAVLPGDAWLTRNGADLASRYASTKAKSWPGAKAAFLKMGGPMGDPQTTDLIRNLPDTTLQPMIDGLVEGVVSQKLPADRCPTIERMVRLLSPLPAENTAELIALAVGLGSQAGSARVGKFSICAA